MFRMAKKKTKISLHEYSFKRECRMDYIRFNIFFFPAKTIVAHPGMRERTNLFKCIQPRTFGNVQIRPLSYYIICLGKFCKISPQLPDE